MNNFDPGEGACIAARRTTQVARAVHRCPDRSQQASSDTATSGDLSPRGQYSDDKRATVGGVPGCRDIEELLDSGKVLRLVEATYEAGRMTKSVSA